VLNTNARQIIAAAAMALIVMVGLGEWEYARAETQLTVLPLNAGHAVFVSGGHDEWLVDCGNEDAVNYTLKSFLRAQGVNKVQRLVLTEGEAKNCGGAKLLDGVFGVGELWTSPAHFRSAVYNRNVAAFEAAPSRHKILADGGTSGCWKVLWPPATDALSRADDSALVLLGNFSGARILLLSDLGEKGQDGLLSRTNDLRADIVVCGLPTEGEPLSDPLIRAIQPKVIVIADSSFPPMRGAGRKLKDRLEQSGVPVIYTRDSGGVTIRVNQSAWRVQAMDGQMYHGK